MKSRRRIWMVALCLLSGVIITVSLRARSTGFLTAHNPALKGPYTLAQPAVYLANGSLRAAALSDAVMLNNDANAQRITGARQSYPSVALPSVEEFILTPPDAAQHNYKTTISVRFPELPAEQLAAQVPITLGHQNVTLQRSADDGALFSAQIDFDWETFLKDQQRRKELASNGRMVPVYKGRDFIRIERMEFVDPVEIENSLRSHQPIRFSPQILIGGPTNVDPAHMLMITDLGVVENTGTASAPGRTYDACINQVLGQYPGNSTGAWAFQTLWMALVNTTSPSVAEDALTTFLQKWENDQPINGFTVPQRPGMTHDVNHNVAGLISNWPKDPLTHKFSLAGPVRLNAIVNRVDLSGQPGQTAGGELRFIFGVTAGTGANQTCNSDTGQGTTSTDLFNIILEYHVPSSILLSTWADEWTSLPTQDFGSGYLSALQAITGQVVLPNKCTLGGLPVSCLFHIRTNEFELAPGGTGQPPLFWEQREFQIAANGQTNTIAETTVSQTLDGRFNTAGLPQCGTTNAPACASNASNFPTWVNQNAQTIKDSEGTEFVPKEFPIGQGFLGGSAFNGFSNTAANGFWNSTSITDPQARRYFSLNTCQGCHGKETATVGFQHVVNRKVANASQLSDFLLGCVPTTGSCGDTPGGDSCSFINNQCPLSSPGQETVPDPVPGNGSNAYGDLLARKINLASVSSPTGAFLHPFVVPHIGVH